MYLAYKTVYYHSSIREDISKNNKRRVIGVSVGLDMQLAFHCDKTKFHSSMPRYVLLNPAVHTPINITIHHTFYLTTVDQEDTEESLATETRNTETRERLMQHVGTLTSVSCAMLGYAIIFLSALAVIGLLAAEGSQ